MTTNSADYCMLINEWLLSRLRVCLLRQEVDIGIQFWDTCKIVHHFFVVAQEELDTVGVSSAPLSTEEELLGALRLKAEAFADKNWEEYWKSEGPSLLARGWVNMHPLIPLHRVEEVCAVDFLCCTMTQLDLTAGSGATSADDSIECNSSTSQDCATSEHMVICGIGSSSMVQKEAPESATREEEGHPFSSAEGR